MAQQRMVKLQNMVNKVIGLNKPEYGIKRKWTKKGQIIPLPYDIVEQMLFDEGFYRMLEKGYLYIPDMQDKIDLGLEPADAIEPENFKVLTDEKIDSLLNKLPYSVFEREIREYSDAQINAIVNYAIANECVSADKCSLLKDITGLDVLKTVATNIDLAKIDKEDKKKK